MLLCLNLNATTSGWNREPVSQPIAFTSIVKVYCKYTTWTFLSPETYSLNVQVRNPQLPNYLHSSEDTDKFHRPEKKNHDTFNVRIQATYLLVKCLEVVCLLLCKSSHGQIFLSKFMDGRLYQIISTRSLAPV